uniref:Uncharacterized protein n=1 Tax=Steinernema glaseri TaxID=37863 RepID=A0A1I7YBA9_9BILA
MVTQHTTLLYWKSQFAEKHVSHFYVCKTTECHNFVTSVALIRLSSLRSASASIFQDVDTRSSATEILNIAQLLRANDPLWIMIVLLQKMQKSVQLDVMCLGFNWKTTENNDHLPQKSTVVSPITDHLPHL